MGTSGRQVIGDVGLPSRRGHVRPPTCWAIPSPACAMMMMTAHWTMTLSAVKERVGGGAASDGSVGYILFTHGASCGIHLVHSRGFMWDSEYTILFLCRILQKILLSQLFFCDSILLTSFFPRGLKCTEFSFFIFFIFLPTLTAYNFHTLHPHTHYCRLIGESQCFVSEIGG